MSYQFDSRLGKQLYKLLPEVYRTRDRDNAANSNSGREDLARYLDAHGNLLDLFHETLQQQLKDTQPLSSQEWLLPYFSQLLAVNIYSPDEEGKHKEVANAVPWRQRKGTLKVVEDIAEVVGQFESEIQEGWQRVALTPRIGMPITPIESTDSALAPSIGMPNTQPRIEMQFPSSAATHPSIAAITVDIRKPSRAVEAVNTNPAAKQSNFAGQALYWRQLNRHGAPCFPNSYEDVSKRTVDLRGFDGRHGLFHHRRMLAYVPPPEGIIPFAPVVLHWADHHDSTYEHLIEEADENGIRVIRNATSRRVIITGDVTLPALPYRIENLEFVGELTVLNGGTLSLHRVVAEKVSVTTLLNDEPVITAEDCLFAELTATGHVELESCTVLDTAFLSSLTATNCIFNHIEGPVDISVNLKYCAYPASAPFSEREGITIEESTTEIPKFFQDQTELSARCVLIANNPIELLFGAVDGGELGGYHRGRVIPVTITGNFNGGNALTNFESNTYVLDDLIFTGEVEQNEGVLNANRCAFSKLNVATGLLIDSFNRDLPALSITNTIVDALSVANGLARLEYCTLMGTLQCLHLQASDCLFVGDITGNPDDLPDAVCIRYSRVPKQSLAHGKSNTTTIPEFVRLTFCTDEVAEPRIAKFGEPGFGVLDQTTSDLIRFGAEDGGEIGAHHHKFYSLKLEAVQDKLQEFLPVNMEAAVIIDRRLWSLPPENNNTIDGEPS